jgi:hypothetical protein
MCWIGRSIDWQITVTEHKFRFSDTKPWAATSTATGARRWRHKAHQKIDDTSSKKDQGSSIESPIFFDLVLALRLVDRLLRWQDNLPLSLQLADGQHRRFNKLGGVSQRSDDVQPCSCNSPWCSCGLISSGCISLRLAASSWRWADILNNRWTHYVWHSICALMLYRCP